jgi:hypothetical protein
MNHFPPLPLEDDAVVLRPIGIGRYFEAAFLGIWLAFWSVFEAVVAGVLGSMLLALFGFLRDSRLTTIGRSALERAPGFEIGFSFAFLGLAIWLALWTFAGLAAWYRFLRIIAGADRLSVSNGVLTLSWRAGPIRRRRLFDRSEVRRIRVRRHDKAIVADVQSGTTTLSDLGSAAQRETACAWLLSRLAIETQPPRTFDPLVPPPGWSATRDESGTLRLSRPSRGRSVAAAIIGGVAGIGALGVVTDVLSRGGTSLGPVVFVALLALVAAWVAWAREEWLARPGQLDHCLRLGLLLKERTFRNARLHIACTIDSDGDAKYKLRVIDASHKRTIASSMYEDTELSDTARWLETVTGFRLE